MPITGKSSQRKGKRHEEHILSLLPQAYRCKQTGDIESYHPFWQRFNIECKDRERWSVGEWIRQSVRDMCKKGKELWCVIFTKNYDRTDYFLCDFQFILEVQRELDELRAEVEEERCLKNSKN